MWHEVNTTNFKTMKLVCFRLTWCCGYAAPATTTKRMRQPKWIFIAVQEYTVSPSEACKIGEELAFDERIINWKCGNDQQKQKFKNNFHCLAPSVVVAFSIVRHLFEHIHHSGCLTPCAVSYYYIFSATIVVCDDLLIVTAHCLVVCACRKVCERKCFQIFMLSKQRRTAEHSRAEMSFVVAWSSPPSLPSQDTFLWCNGKTALLCMCETTDDSSRRRRRRRGNCYGRDIAAGSPIHRHLWFCTRFYCCAKYVFLCVCALRVIKLKNFQLFEKGKTFIHSLTRSLAGVHSFTENNFRCRLPK